MVAKFFKMCFKLNIDSINLIKNKYKKLQKKEERAKMRCCDCT